MKPTFDPEDKDRRRRKLLYVEESRVMGFLAQSRFDPDGVTHIALPWALKLPDDTKVIGVHSDWPSQCFVFVLQSKTFDEVLDCCEAPRIEVEWEYLQVTVQRPKVP